MQPFDFPSMWSTLDQAGLIPLIDLDMNRDGGYLMRTADVAGSESLIAATADPFAGTAPHRLVEATVGFNNRTALVATQDNPVNRPELVDVNGGSLSEPGLRALGFNGSQWLDMSGLNGSFPTLIMAMIRFDWDINANTGAQCLIGWDAPGGVAGIYAGAATGLLVDEVLTMRFPDGKFAYWQSPTAGITGDSWHLVAFYWQNNRWYLRVDGVEWMMLQQGDPDRSSLDIADNWRLGARFYAGGEQGFSGQIAHVVATQHISAVDIASLETAMMRRWPMFRAVEL